MGKPVVDPSKRDRPSEMAAKDIMRQFLYDENIDQFWERLYTKTENLPLVTEIKKPEIPDYVGALWYAKLFRQPWLEDLIEYDLALRVSINRKGRQEATNVLVGTTEREARKSFSLSGLFGRRRDDAAQQ